jgi:hypothetical protein
MWFHRPRACTCAMRRLHDYYNDHHHGMRVRRSNRWRRQRRRRNQHDRCDNYDNGNSHHDDNGSEMRLGHQK